VREGSTACSHDRIEQILQIYFLVGGNSGLEFVWRNRRSDSSRVAGLASKRRSEKVLADRSDEAAGARGVDAWQCFDDPDESDLREIVGEIVWHPASEIREQGRPDS
jgi:hypothetical protein